MTSARTIEPAIARRRAIPRAHIGIVHILWANDDLPELTPPNTAVCLARFAA